MTQLEITEEPARRHIIDSAHTQMMVSDPDPDPDPEPDPDVVALFAEVDAVLRAALPPAPRLPAPPATGCALTPRSAGRSSTAGMRPCVAPVRPVRAVQRSPPHATEISRRSSNS